MRRATTPTHEFTLPIDAALVSRFLATYTQDGKIVLEKREADMTIDGNVWRVKLTQEETNLFAGRKLAHVQIRALTVGGDALASDEYPVYVSPVSNDEVLV